MFVRSVGERDLAAIRELLEATCVEITADEHSIAALKVLLTRPHSEFLVADDGKQFGGMAFAAASSDQKTVLLLQLYVHPDHQRTGIGTMLLQEIEDCFPDARVLRLEVDAANTSAMAFARKHGFVQAGATTHRGPEDTDIPALLVLEKKLG